MSQATNEELRELLSPEQAMADYVMLLRYIQNDLGCSTDRAAANYCPVITIGASYPGFLAAMMRFVYPDVVDIAYASSAPLPLYAQKLDEYAYFDKITDVAEESSPGCAAAVKQTLLDMQDILMEESQHKRVAKQMGIASRLYQLLRILKSSQRRVHDGGYILCRFQHGVLPPERVAGPRQGVPDLSEEGTFVPRKNEGFLPTQERW
jgi:hypothetical protein